jgi:hypothetical protein
MQTICTFFYEIRTHSTFLKSLQLKSIKSLPSSQSANSKTSENKIPRRQVEQGASVLSGFDHFLEIVKISEP